MDGIRKTLGYLLKLKQTKIFCLILHLILVSSSGVVLRVEPPWREQSKVKKKMKILFFFSTHKTFYYTQLATDKKLKIAIH